MTKPNVSQVNHTGLSREMFRACLNIREGNSYHFLALLDSYRDIEPFCDERGLEFVEDEEEGLGEIKRVFFKGDSGNFYIAYRCPEFEDESFNRVAIDGQFPTQGFYPTDEEFEQAWHTLCADLGVDKADLKYGHDNDGGIAHTVPSSDIS